MPLFICPVCDLPLVQAERALRCPQGHSFDVAREGYVNLWLGHKRPFSLGDTADMIAARRRFLEREFYQPLSHRVNQLVGENIKGLGAAVLGVDIGCGEGYYIGRLQASAGGQVGKWAGVDVSKTAVRLAAKKYPLIQFAVANTWHKLPFLTGSVNVLLNIFAPRNAAEFGRVAASGSFLVVVVPGATHLDSLRHSFGLLSIEAEKTERVIAQFADTFVLYKKEYLIYGLDLDATAVQDLVQMTPNAWHLLPEKQNALRGVEHVQTEASFEILLFRKMGSI